MKQLHEFYRTQKEMKMIHQQEEVKYKGEQISGSNRST